MNHCFEQATSDRFYRTLYESLLDPRLGESNKQTMYLNLLFKALRTDKNLGRVMAFVKRLLQVMMGHQPPFICGALYLLGELFSTTSGLATLVNEPEDSGIEHFKDVDEVAKTSETTTAIEADKKPLNEYDGKKRDPLFANAATSCLWELIPFTRHFHPSVSLQANQLLDLRLPLSGSADIEQNTLVAFLDRFAYRNPKKTVSAKGASIMQPAAAAAGHGSATSISRAKGSRVAQADNYVNDKSFWNKDIKDVAPDQLFFHKFFSIKHDREKHMESAKNKRASKKGGDEDDVEDDIRQEEAEAAGGEEQDDESEDSDPEEAEVWKAMQASMPQTQDDLHLMDEDSDDLEDLSQDSEDDDEDDDEDEERVDVEKQPGANTDDQASSDDDDVEFPMDEDSDDLLDLDEMPDIPLLTTSAFPDSDAGSDVDDEVDGKRKRGPRDEKKQERKKKKTRLPEFASVEDYAALINGAPEEDV